MGTAPDFPEPQHMKIATIIGARPQFIKAAAVSRAISAHNHAVCPTAQAAAVRSFKPPAGHPPLYDDGKAAAHCLKALLES